MQFFIYFSKSPDQPMSRPSPEGMAEMGKLMQEGMASGVIVSTGQLGQTTSHIRLEKGEITVTDGPFLEGKELIPGYTLINVASKDEAIAFATKMRQCMGDGVLRMAPVHMGKG